MGKQSDNRFKWSKPALSSLEKRVNDKYFEKESYVYDDGSHLALRIRPNKLFTECVFCLYERVRVKGSGSRLFKRQIMKVGDARNSQTSLTELRHQADSLFLDIRDGQDPIALEKQHQALKEREKDAGVAKRSAREMMFGTVVDGSEECEVDGFIVERRPSVSYMRDIQQKFAVLLSGLLDYPLCEISAEQVKKEYLVQVKKGTTQLHNAMRIFRSLWNWAQTKYDDSELFLRNPVSRAMKQLGVNINRTNRRKVRLDDVDLKPYFESVLSLRDRDHPTAYRNGRDALLFMLFSAVRLQGAVSIRNDDINIKKATFKIIKKGGDEAELPLNSVTAAIVQNRLRHLPENSEYLFPSIKGVGHYRDTTGARNIVASLSGVAVTSHDLRRTYKTIGSELDINSIVIDELLCHAREGVDAHYIHPSMTKLKTASQRVADYLLLESGVDVIGKLNEAW